MIKLIHKINRSLPFILILALFSLPVSALDLDQARAQNLVKETASGYLKVEKPSAEVDALVKKINAGRKNAYKKIAEKQGVSLEVVEQTAGQKLMK